MNNDVIKLISNNLKINESRIKNVINMLQEGSTIPFIARYRKEMTGNLDEDELRSIETMYKYNVNLEDRKATCINLIKEKGMLTDKIKQEIENCTKLSEVEDIYLPFKEKKKTKGTEAIKLGLEPLANLIMEFNQTSTIDIAKPYLSKDVKTKEDAITKAGYIIADKIAENPVYRKWIKEYITTTGELVTKLKKDAKDELRTYENYYKYKEKIKTIKSFRVLAISRAEKEKIVSYQISKNDNKIIEYLEKQILKGKNFPLINYVKEFIKDSYKRLIFPSVERSIKNDLLSLANDVGIKEFGDNLENLLLTPKVKEKVVMGFDPAYRTGCKLAVVNSCGDLLSVGVIYPHMPENDIEGATKTMLDLIKKYNVEIISIGNGTASRESESFVSNLITQNNLNVKYAVVNEAGASVYSASPLAQKEFPSLKVEQRSAISIARRLQDALNELIKIDPKSIGVGLYQHDLKQKELEERLSFVVYKIVNKVGVNINTASQEILLYVSGLDKKRANEIISYRSKKGRISERKELLKIKGITDKVYEQSAGFLRIIDGLNPLDKTNIHPEDYAVVNNILSDYDIDINYIGKPQMSELINRIDNNKVSQKYNISIDKINMIKDNLVNGIIDPRDNLEQIKLKSNVLTIDDLNIGDKIEGVIRNVTSFGAFVDIGLHDDALIHISKISKDYLKHPSEVLKLGDIKTFTVCAIEKDRMRVSLSLID